MLYFLIEGGPVLSLPAHHIHARGPRLLSQAAALSGVQSFPYAADSLRRSRERRQLGFERLVGGGSLGDCYSGCPPLEIRCSLICAGVIGRCARAGTFPR